MTTAATAHNDVRRLERDTLGSVQEWDDSYLRLWPHRFDFLYASHPFPGNKPNWQTESRHPLSDRLMLQGAFLYGVRFGSKTQYAMLDIDTGSPYHPSTDPLALSRIAGALEPLGLVEHLTCTSSMSGGLHLYFPFDVELSCWKVGVGVTALLENAGFKVSPGLLEVFPNAKPFTSDGSLSLYNGHRLPLQQGSYLLNSDLEPTAAGSEEFLRVWRCAVARNDISEATLEEVIKRAQRKSYRVSGKAQKFLNDLNAEIEPGWSGSGQTNRLLGRIAMRAYIFGHVLFHLAKPLVGDDLIAHIIEVANALPGFSDFCGHVEDLADRAKAWAKSVEQSHYYPYGLPELGGGRSSEGSSSIEEEKENWNLQQQEAARERIRTAVASLLEQETLPAGISERFKALAGQGISGATLYKHKDLWHPEALYPVEIPPDPPLSFKGGSEGAQPSAAPSENLTNLLGLNGCNPSSDKGSSDSDLEHFQDKGCNAQPWHHQLPFFNIRKIIQDTKAAIDKNRESEAAKRAKEDRERLARSKAELAKKMRGFLESGDPVLVNEALQWLRNLE